MKSVCYLVMALLLLLATVTPAQATITLPFTTTFDCAEQDADVDDPLVCDNLHWTNPAANVGGQHELITSTANHAAGNGGRAQRHFEGNGTNNHSGGLITTFPLVTELYVRWYMRYESGFAWVDDKPGNDKWLRIRENGTGNVDTIPEWLGNQVNLFVAIANNASSGGWNTVMGGSTGDGLWHWYEVHLKHNTSGNGIGQITIDGILKVDVNDIDYGNGTGWIQIRIGDNNTAPTGAPSTGYAVDFDDIVIQTTGPIGPLAGASTTPGIMLGQASQHIRGD